MDIITSLCKYSDHNSKDIKKLYRGATFNELFKQLASLQISCRNVECFMPHHTVADHMRPDQGIRRKEVNREKRVGRRVDVDINHSLAREWRVLCSSRLCYQIRLGSISKKEQI